MAYIGWPTNVNKTILASTPVTVGEGATVQDSLESGGQKKIRNVCANPPDKYEVAMEFSFAEESKDEHGLTEIDRFWSWYKWAHCYGANPFEFPAILLNSNRQKGFSQEDVSYGNIPDKEYYQITSPVNGSKSGTHQQVTMTWETYATGVIQIPAETSMVDRIVAENGYVDVILTSKPQTEPTDSTWTFTINDQPVANDFIKKTRYDGDVTTRLYFEPFTTPNIYTMRINVEGINPSTFVVGN